MLSNQSFLLKLIGDESRLTILTVLSSGSYCVSELINKTGLSQSLISHHLKDLKDGGLVVNERNSKWIYYRLTAKGRKIVSEKVFVSIKLLKLIGDESRLKLFSVLRSGTHCVSDLIGLTGLSQSLISHHLRDMKVEGLFASQRDGKWVNYFLTKQGQQVASAVHTI